MTLPPASAVSPAAVVAPTPDQLRESSKQRLDEAVRHLGAGVHNLAYEQAGYAAEFALKARICERLGWSEYPSSSLTREGKKLFSIHSLFDLLVMGGPYGHIRSAVGAKSLERVCQWSPECRYRPVADIRSGEARSMVEGATKLLNELAKP